MPHNLFFSFNTTSRVRAIIICKTVPKHVRACPSNDFGSFQIDPKIAIFDPGITILDPRMTSLGITRDFRTRSSVRESAEISTAPGAL